MRRGVVISLLGAIAVSLIVTPSPGQLFLERSKSIGWLPDDTIAAVYIRTPRTVLDALHLPGIGGRLGKDGAWINELYRPLYSLLPGPVLLAVYPDQHDEGRVHYLLLADAVKYKGDPEKNIRTQLIPALLRVMGHSISPDALAAKKERPPVFPLDAEGRRIVSFARSDDVLMISTDAAAVRQWATEGWPAKRLVDRTKFRKLVPGLMADPDLFFYVRTTHLHQAFGEHCPAPVADVLSNIAGRGLHTMVGDLMLRGDFIEGRLVLSLDDADPALARLLQLPNRPAGVLECVPTGAEAFVRTTCTDAQTLAADLAKLLPQAPGPLSVVNWPGLEALAELAGGEWTAFAMNVKDRTGTVLVAPLRRKGDAADQFAKICRANNLLVQTPEGGTPIAMIPGTNVCLAIVQRRLLLASEPAVIARTVAMWKKKDRSLTRTATYRKVTADLPARNAMMAYFKLPAAAKLIAEFLPSEFRSPVSKVGQFLPAESAAAFVGVTDGDILSVHGVCTESFSTLTGSLAASAVTDELQGVVPTDKPPQKHQEK